MVKIILISLILCLALFCLVLPCRAQTDDNPIQASTFGELLDKIIDVIFWIAIIILPLGIITGGIMFLTASGNPSNIELGKKVILYCAVILGKIIMIKTLSFIFKDDLKFTK